MSRMSRLEEGRLIDDFEYAKVGDVLLDTNSLKIVN